MNMGNSNITLDQLIDVFINSKVNSKTNPDIADIKEMLRLKIRQGVEEEIKSIYRDELEMHAAEELEKEKSEMYKKFRIDAAKTLLIDTVVLSGIVGLLVNQATDIVSALKGNTVNVPGTAVAILIFLIAVFIYVQYEYIKKIQNYFDSK